MNKKQIIILCIVGLVVIAVLSLALSLTGNSNNTQPQEKEKKAVMETLNFQVPTGTKGK